MISLPTKEQVLQEVKILEYGQCPNCSFEVGLSEITRFGVCEKCYYLSLGVDERAQLSTVLRYGYNELSIAKVLGGGCVGETETIC